MSDAPGFLSKSEYARHRGVTPAMVTKWLGQSRVVLDPTGKLVDVAKTDAILTASLDPLRRSKTPAAAPSNGGEKQEVAPPAAPVDTAMSRATARDRDLSADLKAVRLMRETGKLVDRESFEEAATEAIAGLREAIMAVPVNLADMLAAEADPRACMILMRDALIVALNTAADMQDALAERAGATRQ